jgi:hypothetical protein
MLKGERHLEDRAESDDVENLMDLVALSDLHPLVPQQPALALEAAAILHQRTICADQAMTRQHHADRVGAVGMADGANGFGHVDPGGERAVTHRGAGRNVRKRVPDLLLERRAGDAPCDA